MHAANGLQFDGTVHGTEQNVHKEQPLSNNSFSVKASVSDQLCGEFIARVGGGWQWARSSTPQSSSAPMATRPAIGVEHPRFQVSVALNNDLSNSVPFYNQFLGGLGSDGGAGNAARSGPERLPVHEFHAARESDAQGGARGVTGRDRASIWTGSSVTISSS